MAGTGAGVLAKPKYKKLSLRDHEWKHANAWIKEWNMRFAPLAVMYELLLYDTEKDCKMARDVILSAYKVVLAKDGQKQDLFHHDVDTVPSFSKAAHMRKVETAEVFYLKALQQFNKFAKWKHR